ncbi:hypothetical protein Hypma_000965 [Hypsizygus marmoreus]|uniref:Uncharacterized protein n=1 Tax=Hypsizygus marmoreus TaxID=39966 RepID=A0A369J9S2_HYPMA|nr:hypothetical protein Hypma_000965 [Hypsizygus marmoreus]
MSSWRNQPSRPSRGRGRAAPRGSQSHLPPKRQMEHIASVSRSSGLEKDGDTLKDFKVQEEYRVFLQGKVDDVLNRHPRKVTESEQEAKQRVDAQENVLILFRKLREGISSSRRTDVFALEVYETSLFLSTAFESPRQTTSVIPHLLPTLYLASPPPHGNCRSAVLISLLHHLVTAYPSQSSFRQLFDTIPSSLFPKDAPAFNWIESVARSLRTQNYAIFEQLTRPAAITGLLGEADSLSNALQSLSISSHHSASLCRRALLGLIDALRRKSRMTTWGIMRAAYREFSCTSKGTRDWLDRSLCLQSVVPYESDIEPERWLQEQSALGHTAQKERVVGKWIIYKAR